MKGTKSSKRGSSTDLVEVPGDGEDTGVLVADSLESTDAPEICKTFSQKMQ